jgi:hypothetical protein
VGLTLCLATVVFLHLSCFRKCLIDDAFITMTYARNLRDHATWGLIPGRTANTATSPLNVLAIAGVSLAVRNVRYAVLVLTALEFVALWYLLRAISRRIFNEPFFAATAFCALLGGLARFNFWWFRNPDALAPPSYALIFVRERVEEAEVRARGHDVLKIGYTRTRWMPECTVVFTRRR